MTKQPKAGALEASDATRQGYHMSHVRAWYLRSVERAGSAKFAKASKR